MQIDEFLLVRIAEDEVSAAPEADLSCGYGSRLCNDSSGMVDIPAAHVLAECEAKRRIVGVNRLWLQDPKSTTFEKDQAQIVLHLLALPYVDHPDYQPEWRR